MESLLHVLQSKLSLHCILDYLEVKTIGIFDQSLYQRNLRQHYISHVKGFVLKKLEVHGISILLLSYFYKWSISRGIYFTSLNLYLVGCLMNRSMSLPITQLYSINESLGFELLSFNLNYLRKLTLHGCVGKSECLDLISMSPEILVNICEFYITFKEDMKVSLVSALLNMPFCTKLYLEDEIILSVNTPPVADYSLVYVTMMGAWYNLRILHISVIHCNQVLLPQLHNHCPLLHSLSFLPARINEEPNEWGTPYSFDMPLVNILSLYRVYHVTFTTLTTPPWKMNTKDKFQLIDDIFNKHPSIETIQVDCHEYRPVAYGAPRITVYDDSTPPIPQYK